MPAGQPFAVATCTVGINCLAGSGIVGLGPTLVIGDATGPVCVGPTDVHAQSAVNATHCTPNANLMIKPPPITRTVGNSSSPRHGASTPAAVGNIRFG